MSREYGQTQVGGLNWACPDCGAVVEFFHGRPIHDRWHTEHELLRREPKRPKRLELPKCLSPESCGAREHSCMVGSGCSDDPRLKGRG